MMLDSSIFVLLNSLLATGLLAATRRLANSIVGGACSFATAVLPAATAIRFVNNAVCSTTLVVISSHLVTTLLVAAAAIWLVHHTLCSTILTLPLLQQGVPSTLSATQCPSC